MEHAVLPLKIRVLHAPTDAEPFVVVDKPSGLPTAPLRDGDTSALTQAIALFPAIAHVQGKKAVEKGLVHRIDTATRGCVLIALTQWAYDYFQAVQKNAQFKKWYRATVDHIPDAPHLLGGFPESPAVFSADAKTGHAFVQSRFRGYGKNGSAVRPVTAQSGLAAQKKATAVLYQTEITLHDDTAICAITAGYRHQVRCHLAWLGLPVQHDPVYHPQYQNEERAGALRFTAYRLDFPHPKTHELMSIQLEES